MFKIPVVLLSSAALAISALPTAAVAIAAPGFPSPVVLASSGTDVLTTAASNRNARKVAKGPRGNKIRVSRISNLAPGGTFITVKGAGFSETVGVYVALCKKKRAGLKPGPCGGGSDLDGSSQASAWVSSNPPPYGRTLATPYARGGKFQVRIKVSARIGTYNCRPSRCAIVVRADHLNGSDRRWDLSVPVRFR